ncbi:MAG: prephenate/arogenate dehydrogenase [Symploca sp. SIO3C6]|uniref:Prephenate/arogenate dehydrogenase n=1 Tax=Symploca sp. SIO1C4 TaxID=2607765 RepID=A0A6B3NAT6_9CYAN|nr:prephenate/arogenate dehydrogenase [Symploca sp. SIO3C6]NER27134.1 prephenate/arogenate dehydrogenase [Symploca sp. SIO1C4]NET08161.1 prephenate/arogenate dehydrogenase [Symploca sp. SIO2B6]
MNIGIVGLGLIGGSLGLDLRACGYRVLGVSRQQLTCQRAIERGIVDDASIDLKLLATADVVFVCTPIAAITIIVQQLIPHLGDQTVITDVGSTKKAVVEAITPLWSNFVGGHPMAGTEESGIDAALSNLFANKPYLLTPIETTPPDAVKMVEKLVRSLTTKVYICSPEDHDRAVAWISHLPVMVSHSLIDACTRETNPMVLQLAQAMASSGFRDTTRVGGGNPELGMMMARYNKHSLLRSLGAYRQSLDQIIELVEQEDWQALTAKLQHGKCQRAEFLDSKKKYV